MEERTWEEEIEEIDAEVARMGGGAVYNALPAGFMAQSKFQERCDAFSNAMKRYEGELVKIEEERCIIRRKMECAVRGEREGLEKYLRSLDVQEENCVYEECQAKTEFLDFLERNRPMDAVAFLREKHALLDRKIGLLVKVRLRPV